MGTEKFRKVSYLIEAGAMGMAVTFICGCIYLAALVVALLNIEMLPDRTDDIMMLLAWFVPLPGVIYAVLDFKCRCHQGNLPAPPKATAPSERQ